MHTGREGQAAMPYLDAYPIREVDILLISQYVDPLPCLIPSHSLVLPRPASTVLGSCESHEESRSRLAIMDTMDILSAILSSTINTMFTTF